MADPITIRDEMPKDFEQVRKVTIDAFTGSELGYHGEADLVDQVRANCDRYLSIVACAGESVIGHLFFSPAQIKTEEGRVVEGMGLAPMSVDPAHQRQGVGEKLIRASLDRLKDSKSEFVVVLGHPDYYRRFGFKPSEPNGITHGFVGIPQDVFFVHWLRQPREVVGKAYFRDEFGVQHETAG